MKTLCHNRGATIERTVQVHFDEVARLQRERAEEMAQLQSEHAKEMVKLRGECDAAVIKAHDMFNKIHGRKMKEEGRDCEDCGRAR
jgi:hypothetical protein